MLLKIQFKVKAEAGQNQQIQIVGSLPQLGSWDPFKGLTMQRVSHGQWQSEQPIEVPENLKFQFKVIKIKGHGHIEWEKLPNNSNRKFKPKFHCRLIINWSIAEGKVVNQAKQSYKVKGLPAAFIKSRKNYKKSSLFDPLKKATQSDSQKQEQDGFSFLQKKTSSDPRMKINIQDIEEMYYDTTEVQMAYGQIKKPKIYIVCSSLDLYDSFQAKIAQQADLMQQIHFKWFYYNTKQQIPVYKRIIFHRVPDSVIQGQRSLSQEVMDFNYHSANFIFLDLKSTKNVDVNNTKACLFLKGQQYEEVQQKIQQLKQFKFIAFDRPNENKRFFQFLSNARSSSQIEQSDSQPNNFNQNKPIGNISLIGLIEELHIEAFAKAIKVNTVYSISEEESLQQILQYNSILIIDCALKQANNGFFQKLITEDITKRMIIVVAPDHCPESIKQYIPRRDIVIVSGNYQKIRMKEKVHQPKRKHLQIVTVLKMKVKLFKEIYGGEFSCDNSSIIYKNEQKPQLFKKIQNQLKTVLKDMNYFKLSVKKSKIKVTWCLASQIRLIRTLCRIKYLSQGKIGNFQLISVDQNFEDLKNQIKMLVEHRTFFLQNPNTTKVDHYSYGNKVQAKYTIIPDNLKHLNNLDTNSQKIQEK